MWKSDVGSLQMQTPQGYSLFMEDRVAPKAHLLLPYPPYNSSTIPFISLSLTPFISACKTYLVWLKHVMEFTFA